MATEVFETLQTSSQVKIERIVSLGHSSPEGFWYDQSEQEWLVILRGAAILQFEDRMLELAVGDFVHVAAHQKHRVAWTTPEEPTIWLAIYYC